MSQPLQPPNLGPFNAWDTLWFRQEIFKHGSPVLWEKAMTCPCRRVHNDGGLGSYPSKTHRQDCPACRGSGTMYIDGQPVKAIVNEARHNPTFYQIYGSKAEGMARLTLLPECVPGKRDRFTVLNSVRVVEDEYAVREGASYTPTFPVVTRDTEAGTDADPTVAETITTGVDAVWSANADGTINRRLVVDDDYAIVGGAVVFNDAGNPPDLGEGFAIRYYAHDVYVVRVIPHTHRDFFSAPGQQDEQPRRVDCWLIDYDPFPEEYSG